MVGIGSNENQVLPFFILIEDQVVSSESGGLSCFSGLLELGPAAWLVQFLKRYNENWGVPYNVKLII